MNSNEIQRIMENMPWIQFQGVYSIDTLPSELDTSLIFNHEPSNLSGSHWSCLMRCEDYITYYDPLAFPTPDMIAKYVGIRSSKFYSFKQPSQTLGSVTCGHHCIYFLYHLLPARNDSDAIEFINNI